MSAPELLVGYVVAGKYTIRTLLLHGGSMVTYRAVAPKNKEVALKLYDPGILSFPEVVKTLAQHRSIGAKLSPDQIVPIADSGTDSNSGAPFTVTDFEPGPSLARLIERRPLPVSDMVSLVRNLARVTDLLHSSGVAGLSLHPANVFVRPGAQYEVRIADFGASLVRGVIPAPEKAGRWMPWLAPEQIKGQPPPAQTADIFALGLLAFFAVTGKPYWRACQLKAPDTMALRREILGERMPVSVRASDFSINLNPAVDAVFARALAFKPSDRYSTAREFAVGLDAALSGRSVAEADAAREQMANVAASAVHTGEAEPSAHRASSPDASPDARRIAAPPPRKMAQRATMLGMGTRPDEQSGATAGPRPPLSTMVGMGEAEAPPAPPANPTALRAATPPAKIPAPALASAPAKGAPPATSAPAMTTAPAKPFAPAMTTAPAKTSAPAKTTAPTKPYAPAIAAPTGVRTTTMIAVAPPAPAPAANAGWPAPAMPVAPAMSAVPPMVVTPGTTASRGAPPPLPMGPPPSQLEEVLARFEAGPPDLSPARASPVFSTPSADVVQTPPVWSTADLGDSGAERVETGVAVLGADLADTPKKPRLFWIASACGLLVVIGGGAWALSGTSGAHGRAATDAKVTPAAGTKASPAEPPSATANPHPANAELQAAAETLPEPVAPAAPPPAAQEPEKAEPAAPAADDNAAAKPTMVPGGSDPSPTSAARPTPAGPQPSKKPCGKFLKRCN